VIFLLFDVARGGAGVALGDDEEEDNEGEN
jgi:hypothetical protein